MTSLAGLEKSNISKKNKKAIYDFHNYCLSQDLDPQRIAKQIYETMHLSKWLGINFDKVKRKHIEKLVMHINSLDRSPSTKKDYRGITKRFFRWYLEKTGKYKWDGAGTSFPEIVSWVRNKTKEKDRNVSLQGSLLKEEDILKVLSVAKTPRNKALVFLLWESGMRAGEILNLRIVDIQTNKYGYEINICFGKTSARKITAIQSSAVIANYLNHHEERGNPEAFLFPITYRRFKQIIEGLCKKADVNGKLKNPHSWRKARATFLASHMTTDQMMAYFGWSSPKTTRSYVFASQDIILPALLKLNGMKQEEESTKLTIRNCLRCGEKNSVESRFCNKCSMPLTKESINLLETKTIDTANRMGKFETKLKPHEISIFQRAIHSKATKKDINNLAQLMIQVKKEGR